MARLNEHTSLVAVKERNRVQVKILFSRNGKVKRYKTHVYVKDAKLFNQEKIFRKNNSEAPDEFQADKVRLDEAQLKIETIIEDFILKFNDKPTPAQIDKIIINTKEVSKINYTYISSYLEEYYKLYENKGRNAISVVGAIKSGYDQFCLFQNTNYNFDDVNEDFLKGFINYLLFYKPKNQKHTGKPKHSFSAPITFDDQFGMNNNTLLKRMDVWMSFLKWSISKKGVKLEYELVKELLKKVKKELQISEYTNLEFAFKKREDIKLLASQDFDEALHSDYYTELVAGKEVIRPVSREVLIRAKDYFVISTLTANRISDLKLIKRHHLEMGRQKAKKTQNEFLLNANQTIKELFEKHNFNLGMNDQKYNKVIKVFLKQFYSDFLKKVELVWVKENRGQYEQFKEVEYYKLAGSHSGRRSFASVLYNEGRYPKRMIMQFTGHTSEQEFDKYIQLSPVEDIQEVSVFMNINYI